jgi:hypothetical protein
LQRTLASWFASTSAHAQAATQQAQLTRKGHGRVDRYQLRSTTALNRYLAEEYQWPELGQVACISHQRIVLATGEVNEASHYVITTMPPEMAPPALRLQEWRAQWQIENQSHWVRDVVFGEDAAQIRTGALPEVLALLRAAVITRLRGAGMERITAARSQVSAERRVAEFLVGIPSDAVPTIRANAANESG